MFTNVHDWILSWTDQSVVSQLVVPMDILSLCPSWPQRDQMDIMALLKHRRGESFMISSFIGLQRPYTSSYPEYPPARTNYLYIINIVN